jgi:DNA-binding beta-propeller fold protein YncE
VTTGGLWNFTEEAVSVVDIGTGQVVGEPLHTGISTGDKRTLWDSWSGITISPDGRNAYTTDGWSNAVVVVDVVEGRVVPRPIKVGNYALGIAPSPNGRLIYAATAQGVSVIDAHDFASTLVPFFA